jgi:DNA-binding MurR/RpiR family transcriptional regulator
MDEATFLRKAGAEGFSASQAAFLWEHTAQRPHSHTSDEIIVDPDDGETLESFVDAVSEALSEDEEAEDLEETVG